MIINQDKLRKKIEKIMRLSAPYVARYPNYELTVDQLLALIKKDRKELIEEMSQIIIKSAVAESKDTIFVKLTKTLFNSLKEK